MPSIPPAESLAGAARLRFESAAAEYEQYNLQPPGLVEPYFLRSLAVYEEAQGKKVRLEARIAAVRAHMAELEAGRPPSGTADSLDD